MIDWIFLMNLINIVLHDVMCVFFFLLKRIIKFVKMQHCDIITMILYRWPYTNLIQISHLFIQILERPSGNYKHFILDSEECEFADNTLIPNHDTLLTYCQYYRTIYECANQEEFNDYRVLQLKACFIIGLVYDARIRRFCLTDHIIHDKIGSKPTNSEKTFEFIKKIESLVSGFLDSNITLELMTFTTIDEWQTNFLFY